MLHSNNLWALYERKFEHSVQYEVVKFQKRQGGIVYPATSLWGIYGFTYNALEDAQKQFNAKATCVVRRGRPARIK